ncbi:GNAT family N-acetyltransferase [Streptomyces xiamenensis]|uniref:GNAT family N-acetyltransferase n=1 Tax=Streptomyces xiamenensis TaxID=408015 RepID=UPI0035DF07ED
MSSPIDPILWARSETCGLGPYRTDLVETYWRWAQDPAVMVGYGRQAPESLEARIEGMRQQQDGGNIRFTIYDLTADGGPSPAGVATLLPDHGVRTAEYVVMLAAEARGRHLATPATRLVLDYAFRVVNLRMVWLQVLEPNLPAIRAYERAGFRHAGRFRQAGFWLGQLCDEIVMDVLVTEFSGGSVISDPAAP